MPKQKPRPCKPKPKGFANGAIAKAMHEIAAAVSSPNVEAYVAYWPAIIISKGE